MTRSLHVAMGDLVGRPWFRFPEGTDPIWSDFWTQRLGPGPRAPRALGFVAIGRAGVIAGALLGALHGVERLPTELWSLELGWIVDTPARDRVVQLDEPRSLDAGPVEDQRWLNRYPGW